MAAAGRGAQVGAASRAAAAAGRAGTPSGGEARTLAAARARARLTPSGDGVGHPSARASRAARLDCRNLQVVSAGNGGAFRVQLGAGAKLLRNEACERVVLAGPLEPDRDLALGCGRGALHYDIQRACGVERQQRLLAAVRALNIALRKVRIRCRRGASRRVEQKACLVEAHGAKRRGVGVVSGRGLGLDGTASGAARAHAHCGRASQARGRTLGAERDRSGATLSGSAPARSAGPRARLAGREAVRARRGREDRRPVGASSCNSQLDVCAAAAAARQVDIAELAAGDGVEDQLRQRRGSRWGRERGGTPRSSESVGPPKKTRSVRHRNGAAAGHRSGSALTSDKSTIWSAEQDTTGPEGSLVLGGGARDTGGQAAGAMGRPSQRLASCSSKERRRADLRRPRLPGPRARCLGGAAGQRSAPWHGARPVPAAHRDKSRSRAPPAPVRPESDPPRAWWSARCKTPVGRGRVELSQTAPWT